MLQKLITRTERLISKMIILLHKDSAHNAFVRGSMTMTDHFENQGLSQRLQGLVVVLHIVQFNPGKALLLAREGDKALPALEKEYRTTNLKSDALI